MSYGRIWWGDRQGNKGHGDWLPLDEARRIAVIYENETPGQRIVKVEVKEDHELEPAG